MMYALTTTSPIPMDSFVMTAFMLVFSANLLIQITVLLVAPMIFAPLSTILAPVIWAILIMGRLLVPFVIQHVSLANSQCQSVLAVTNQSIEN